MIRTEASPSAFLFLRFLRSTSIALIAFSLGLYHLSARAAEVLGEAPEPLIQPDGSVPESVLEAFLSPSEFAERRFIYESRGDQALFAVDAGLSATPPLIELHPERIEWPRIADVPLKAENKPLPLTPKAGLSDEALDEGFKVRWVVQALGQRFSPEPSFAARVVAATVIGTKDGAVLAAWQAKTPAPICRGHGPTDTPKCRLQIGFEVRAVALSPDGALLSLAFGGLRPRIEVYDIRKTPRLIWQAVFTKESGGAVETAFSADGEWVTALTAGGVMHRFAAAKGGRHLAVPSSGLTALAVPPGRMMAVAGKSGEITVWYLADGTVAKKFPPRDSRGTVDRLAASGNGEVIGTIEYRDSDTVIRLWHLDTR